MASNRILQLKMASAEICQCAGSGGGDVVTSLSVDGVGFSVNGTTGDIILTSHFAGGTAYSDYLFWDTTAQSGSGAWGSDGAKVHIGSNAGSTNQGDATVAIGVGAGETNQTIYAVAIGSGAGATGQGGNAVAIGVSAGNIGQGINSVAIGNAAGSSGQGANSVAIGPNAGSSGQGDNAIAIGNGAGVTDQHESSIILNASPDALNVTTTGFFVNPIRNVAGLTGFVALYYNPTTHEIGCTGV
jgi:Head domain of trimeric autotransporter adhesin